MNDDHLATVGTYIRKVVMAHEIGHVFGLGHQNDTQNCGDTFMVNAATHTSPTTLRDREVNWININY